jgi:peptidoglycan hydrolase-like amidase
MKRCLTLYLALVLLLIPGGAWAQPENQGKKTIYNTPYPSVIRVAIRESPPDAEPNPWGRILYVKEVPFDEYVQDSLPNEWGPDWRESSLDAGAIAVKMFAWYKTLNPTTLDGWTFDVDNTTNFQVYRPGKRYDSTNQAHQRTRNVAFAMPDGEIIELNYRSGYPDDPNWQYRNANMMAQWGSKYWAERNYTPLQILQWYFEGRSYLAIPNL